MKETSVRSWPKRSVRLLGCAIAALIGYSLATQVHWYLYALPLTAKLTGRAPHCPWAQLWSGGEYASRVETGRADAERRMIMIAADGERRIQQWRLAGHRDFWIPQDGEEMNGKALLSYLLVDHELMASRWQEYGVRAGDIVLDCGAHVGVFTEKALDRGARKVVAIEPDALNRECLTRNFAAEIASGRVVVVSQGVWSSSGRLSLQTSTLNSGRSTVLAEGGSTSNSIEVRTIDDIVQQLDLHRVDFIKLDIEGAEREALRGAANTLREFSPRLMMDAYHRPDDPVVLPGLVNSLRPGYGWTCGPCDFDRWTARPHVMFAEWR